MNQLQLQLLDQRTDERIRSIVDGINVKELLRIDQQLAAHYRELTAYTEQLNGLQQQMERSLATIANANIRISTQSKQYKETKALLQRVQKTIGDSILPTSIYEKYDKNFDYLLVPKVKEDIPAILRVYDGQKKVKIYPDQFEAFLLYLYQKMSRFLAEHLNKMIIYPYAAAYNGFAARQGLFLQLDADLQVLQGRYMQVLHHFAYISIFLFETGAARDIAPVIAKIKGFEDQAVFAHIKQNEVVLRAFQKCVAFTTSESEFFSPFSDYIELFAKRVSLKSRHCASERCCQLIDLQSYKYLEEILHLQSTQLQQLVLNILPFDFQFRFFDPEFDFAAAAQEVQAVAQDSAQRQRLTSIYPFGVRFVENYASDFFKYYLVARQRQAQYYQRACGQQGLENAELQAQSQALYKALKMHADLIFSMADLPGAILILQNLISLQIKDLVDYFGKLTQFRLKAALNVFSDSVKIKKAYLFAIRLGCLVRGYSADTKDAFDHLRVFDAIFACIDNCETTQVEKANCLAVIGKIGAQQVFMQRAMELVSEINSIVSDEEFALDEMRRWKRGRFVV